MIDSLPVSAIACRTMTLAYVNLVELMHALLIQFWSTGPNVSAVSAKRVLSYLQVRTSKPLSLPDWVKKNCMTTKRQSEVTTQQKAKQEKGAVQLSRFSLAEKIKQFLIIKCLHKIPDIQRLTVRLDKVTGA
jgi:hypothetical protein